jgi:hypothetical protein
MIETCIDRRIQLDLFWRLSLAVTIAQIHRRKLQQDSTSPGIELWLFSGTRSFKQNNRGGLIVRILAPDGTRHEACIKLVLFQTDTASRQSLEQTVLSVDGRKGRCSELRTA